MAFIQYFSQAESDSLFDSYVPILENYGMSIPKKFNYSKQLYAEISIPNKTAKTPKPDIIFKEDIIDYPFVLIDLTVNKEQHQMSLLIYP